MPSLMFWEKRSRPMVKKKKKIQVKGENNMMRQKKSLHLITHRVS